MSDIILKVENVSKQYRLGVVGTGTISHDLNRWWYKIRGKEDPFLKIGDSNDRSTKGNSEYVWALKDINFEVKRGEVLGIIGKNGAGKSTLLKILSKVTSPTTGSIKSKGRIASLLEVGTGFHPEMTGKENIFLNGAILGMTKKEINAKLDEIIEFSGCERYIDTPVKRYSSGMKVRLAFAVAAHLEPDILVVDEVLAVGDAEFQKKAIGKMQDISNTEGRTVLFVSHDMVAVQNLCSSCILLENGLLKKRGATNDVIKFYLTSDEKNKDKNDSYDLTKSSKFTDSKYFQLVKLEIIDEILGKGFKVTSCKSCEFKIYYTAPNLLKKAIKIGITIKDDFFKPLMTFNSTFINKSLCVEKTNDFISCKVDTMNLASGDYHIHIWFIIDEEKEIIIENAGKFLIVKNNIYGTGILPDPFYHGNIIHKGFSFGSN
ncbi:MAG: ABC transporter ATP-binding protein [Flavobacteriaceae bacterium]|nr:ABC transporter ATP-binding protein [Flavobacteriaceae bacterium]